MTLEKNDKIKIIFVLPALTAGGAERVLITLMNDLDRIKYELVFITISDEGPMKNIIDHNIPFHSLQGKRTSRAILKLYGKIKELKPDVVVSTMAHMNFCVLLLKPFFSKTHFIVREAVTPSFFLDKPSIKSTIIKNGYKRLYPRADCVISPAQTIIDEFKNTLSMPCKNHVLLRNPVDIERIRKEESTPFEYTGEKKNTLHFIASGRLHHQKGFDRLISILPEMNSPYDWKLTILGEGPERQALENLVKEKELQHKIDLPGFSNHPWPHYAAADCFLMPSRWEGLPNAALESLACGTPVIATHESGGIEEIMNCANEGDVTVVPDMVSFLKAMEKRTPDLVQKFRPSLLPEDFDKTKVMTQFSQIIDSVLET